MIEVTFLPNGANMSDYGWSLYRSVDDGEAEAPAYNASLPLSGSWVVIAYPYGFSTLPLNKSLAFGDDNALMASSILDAAIVYYQSPNASSSFTGASGEQPQVHALEVVFYSCVKELEVMVVDGNVTTNVVSSSYRQSNVNMSTIFSFQCANEGDNLEKIRECGFAPIQQGPTFYSFLGSPSSNATKSSPVYTFYRQFLSNMSTEMFGFLRMAYSWGAGNIIAVGDMDNLVNYISAVADPDPAEAFRIISEALDLIATAATNV